MPPAAAARHVGARALALGAHVRAPAAAGGCVVAWPLSGWATPGLVGCAHGRGGHNFDLYAGTPGALALLGRNRRWAERCRPLSRPPGTFRRALPFVDCVTQNGRMYGPTQAPRPLACRRGASSCPVGLLRTGITGCRKKKHSQTGRGSGRGRMPIVVGNYARTTLCIRERSGTFHRGNGPAAAGNDLSSSRSRGRVKPQRRRGWALLRREAGSSRVITAHHQLVVHTSNLPS